MLAVAGMAIHCFLRFAFMPVSWPLWALQAPLWVVLALGGIPLVWGLLRKALRREFGSDLLAGISILTSVALQEYLAGSFVVLMLSGGEALEAYAVGRASAVLDALARRMPNLAHLQKEGQVVDATLEQIQVGDRVVVFPHEISPVDGLVVEGRGSMDESYLTGEPYRNEKIVGSEVMSGAINGDSSLTVQATALAKDSRHAKIMEVMRDSEERRPQMRRLGDQMGAWYTPLAVTLALLAWVLSGEPRRFLAVLVVATPCPLLIAIPVAIIGAISLAARRGIIVRDPSVLEQVDNCRTMILDKTGTMTCGRAVLTSVTPFESFREEQCLSLAASLERYSRHPLAQAISQAARQRGLVLEEAQAIREAPGKGMVGTIGEFEVELTGRKKLEPAQAERLAAKEHGLEAVLLVDGKLAAVFSFHDEPRADTRNFLEHLHVNHRIQKLMVVSGDREEEVRFLAKQVGLIPGLPDVLTELHAGQTPEQKVALVRAETLLGSTLYIGDGINDAPALAAATVGLALGQASDVTTEAAGAVVLDSSLKRVDEFMHIGRRMKRIALQSAVGGMALSVVGMVAAALGWLPPLAGAIAQEVIDLVAVLNALRMAYTPASLSDYQEPYRGGSDNTGVR